ncbi:dihydroorotase [Polaribacter sp.]|uniref:dihydroorotase n=1 Tax=Polaribacter sp. TaxID=1920175 RepID=UPI0025DC437C|nr:dihydroorotase [Polaribacter sp.]
MKTSIFTLFVCAFLSLSSFSQKNSDSVKVGDIFTIAKVEMNNYKHIKFPKDNFIIKKGGIANYKNIVNQKVKITALEEKKNGKTQATIQLTSGRSFFKSHKYIKVDLKKALSSKELI